MTREEAAIDYCLFIGNTSLDEVDAFQAGADWEHKRLVEKACEWLKENMYIEHIFEYDEDEKPVQYVCASTCDSVDEFLNNFRKAMENNYETLDSKRL